MLGRGKVGGSRVSVPMSDAVCKFFPEVGEQRIKLGGALAGDGPEVREDHWTEDESQGLSYCRWVIRRNCYSMFSIIICTCEVHSGG